MGPPWKAAKETGAGLGSDLHSWKNLDTCSESGSKLLGVGGKAS